MKIIDAFMRILAASLVAATVVITCAAVYYRYVLNSALLWPEEIAGHLLVWISFVGAYLALRKEGHLSFDLLLDHLPKQTGYWIRLAIEVLLILFFGMIFVLSIKLISVVGATHIETADIPQGLFMLVLPIASFGIMLGCLINLKNHWKGRP
jgi:TRAP-type C4-dicarboxylate transport system permease small subunit